SARTEQYYEIGGNRSFYRDGWEAVTNHYLTIPFDEEPWALFNVEDDPTQTTDLSSEHPHRLVALQQARDRAAWDNWGYPIDDGRYMHAVMFDPDAYVPDSLTIPRSAHTLDRTTAARLILERSFTLTVDFRFAPGDRGVLVAHGDQGGGYVVYVEDDT